VDWEPIHKQPRRGAGFNLADYDLAVRDFSWDRARAELDGLPGGRGPNIAYEAVTGMPLGRAGMRRRCDVAKDDTVTDITYADLASRTSRFANALRSLGVGRGERVFSLLPRLPELYVAALGTLKNASVFSPLFPAFGPEPIRERMRIGAAKVLVTSPELYQRKIAPVGAPDGNAPRWDQRLCRMFPPRAIVDGGQPAEGGMRWALRAGSLSCTG
jgi:acetyl-CoA synthetase